MLDLLFSNFTTFRTFKLLTDIGVVAFAFFDDGIKVDAMPSVTVQTIKREVQTILQQMFVGAN